MLSGLNPGEGLPLKPDPVHIAGRLVDIRPLEPAADSAALHRASCGDPIDLGHLRVGAYDPGALIWRYLAYGPFSTAAELEGALTALSGTPDLRALCVRDRSSGRPVGVVCLMSNSPAHRRVELGHIWYSPAVQGAGFNRETGILLMGHCFELGYRRLEWKCDSRNERSRRAALGLGFRFEGIQECHMIVKGESRDTAWFRLLDHEWPDVRVRHEQGRSGGDMPRTLPT